MLNTKIFILHHLPAASRKQILLQDLQKTNLCYPVTWVETFLPEDIQHVVKNITFSELSLSLKHKFVFEQVIKNDLQHAIVFEDDVDLNSVYDINSFLQQAINEIQNVSGDLLWIGNIKKWNMYHIPKEKKTNENISYFNEQCLSRCTHAYIISNNGAKTMLNNFHNNLPIDHLFNDVIQKYKLLSGWSEPYLTQLTAEGLLSSLIGNY